MSDKKIAYEISNLMSNIYRESANHVCKSNCISYILGVNTDVFFLYIQVCLCLHVYTVVLFYD